MADPAIPAITVLMPVYNAAPHLREAVRSVLDQSFTDLELLAIDDGSTDDSADILRSFADQRVRMIDHAGNMGLIASLNEGIDHARGAFIARMDADDVMHPERLRKQLEFLTRRPEVSLVACFVDLINADGEEAGTWDVDRATPDEASVRRMLPKANCIAHGSVMVRAEAMRALRYSPRKRHAEDWDLWLRMLARGHRLAKIPEPLLRLRMHAGSIMAGEKKNVVELRLLKARHRFLVGDWSRLRASPIHLRVIVAQARSLARHLVRNVGMPLARGAWRLLSYSPIRLLRERRALSAALHQWNGEHLFLFPYLDAGGAENVHARIIASVNDRRPLVLITGFSTDRAFEDRFRRAGTVVELPRLLNHPLTRAAAVRAIAAAINAGRAPVLFSSLTATFWELLPLLGPRVRAIHLQHAFLHQPAGNLAQRGWLPLIHRVDRFVFVARHAMSEFEKFLLANHVPRSRLPRMEMITNAVGSFGAVKDHHRLGVLFVGRDSPEKRLDLFLDLARRLDHARAGRFRFTVVGSGARPGHAHVTFTGTVRDPAALDRTYGEHDVLVLTSSREGFPMVVAEAMAHGLAVISTPVGDVPGRLDERTAILTSSVEGSTAVAEMEAAILALDADRERLRRMKEAALAHAGIEFDPGVFSMRYRALLAPASS